MKVLFVQPHTSVILETLWGKLSRKLNFFPNLQIQQLAASTPKDHKIKIIDERHKRIDFNEPCDLVVMHFRTEDAVRTYEVADEFRQNGKTVILGGWHPTALPEEAKQHADSVLVGETEITWPKLLKEYKNGSLQPFYIQEKPVDPSIIPAARRDVGDSFFPIARIQATRGCPHQCEFCRIPYMEGKTLRKRPIENVIEELKSIRQKFLFFTDASLTLDPEYSKSLFREMKGLHKKFCCGGNPDILSEDDEFLKLAQDAGCIAWYVGFESISQETIDTLGKKTNRVCEYASTVKKIHDNHMAVFGSFNFGFDTDTPDVFEETLKAMYDLKLNMAEINVLTPFPGTPLFTRLDKEGRILTRNWVKYNEGEVVFKPKNMSELELFQNVIEVCDKFAFLQYNSKRIVESMKLGFYPFLITLFQTLFW